MGMSVWVCDTALTQHGPGPALLCHCQIERDILKKQELSFHNGFMMWIFRSSRANKLTRAPCVCQVFLFH